MMQLAQLINSRSWFERRQKIPRKAFPQTLGDTPSSQQKPTPLLTFLLTWACRIPQHLSYTLSLRLIEPPQKTSLGATWWLLLPVYGAYSGGVWGFLPPSQNPGTAESHKALLECIFGAWKCLNLPDFAA